MVTGKRIIIAIFVLALGIALVQQASARGWGGGMGYGGGGCYCQGLGPGYQNLDDATKAKVDAFRAETVGLRKQIAMKRAEKMALMNSAAPDVEAVAKVAGELFDLRSSMIEKAKNAGVPMMGGGGRMGGMMGKAAGQGRGSGPCYNQMMWN